MDTTPVPQQATAAPKLVHDDAFIPATVAVGLDRERASARWYTNDGYVVYRTGQYRYWVRDKQGRFACQSTLAQAGADIQWLRARGR
ncbi:hypothetical protein ACSNOI_03240 [Actinomadura kijaniata]|uniref:hypothetical protein n=1 Tax=Actinomadura kijaniata TaxID=46161 RepID=UPI003F1E39A8